MTCSFPLAINLNFSLKKEKKRLFIEADTIYGYVKSLGQRRFMLCTLICTKWLIDGWTFPSKCEEKQFKDTHLLYTEYIQNGKLMLNLLYLPYITCFIFFFFFNAWPVSPDGDVRCVILSLAVHFKRIVPRWTHTTDHF